MNTQELVITDLLNCGYADISMLDILYSPLAEDVGIETAEVLRNCIKFDGDLNNVLAEVYSAITESVCTRLKELLDEYKDTLQDDKPTTDTENTDLYDLISEYMYNNSDELVGLSEEQLNKIEETISNMENSYPFCNFLDSYFQNVLDQTLNEDGGVDENVKSIIEYVIQD